MPKTNSYQKYQIIRSVHAHTIRWAESLTYIGCNDLTVTKKLGSGFNLDSPCSFTHEEMKGVSMKGVKFRDDEHSVQIPCELRACSNIGARKQGSLPS